jgi:hypothetical protein
MTAKVIRLIEAYEKQGDELVEEVPIKHISLEALQEIFGIPRENPMYDNCPINESQYLLLKPYLDKSLDLSKLDYYLTCYSLEE